MASEDFSFESSYFMSTTDSRHVSFCIVPPSPNAKQSLLQDSDDKDFQFNIGSAAKVNDSSFESPKKKHGIHRSTESMAPSVAFADELFCDGKVKASGCRIPAAVASSQRSPLMRRNSLWNDDFDPFVTALERVKDNHRVNTLNHRRAQSSSPFYHHPLLRETKGVDFSRRLREVRTLGNYGDSGRETKKQKLMRFLTIRSKSVEKEEDGDHHESKRSETEKKAVAMAMAFTASATRNGSRAVTKVPAMQYRSRLLLCLGYGF